MLLLTLSIIQGFMHLMGYLKAAENEMSRNHTSSMLRVEDVQLKEQSFSIEADIKTKSSEPAKNKKKKELKRLKKVQHI